MTKTYPSDTIVIGGANKANMAEGYKGIAIGKQRYIPELVIKRKTPVKKILLLPATPPMANSDSAYFHQEVDRISRGLQRSSSQECWEIHSRLVSQLRDLRWVLLEQEPHVVHFIGQGYPQGLFIQNPLGGITPIPPSILASSSELCADTVECVILWAAYWEPQAEAICQHIDYVIGLPHSINQNTAYEFIMVFYDALGAGKTIEDAFYHATQTIQQDTLHTPILKIKESIRKHSQCHA